MNNERQANEKYPNFVEDQAVELKSTINGLFETNHKNCHTFINDKNELKDYNINVNVLNYEPLSKNTDYQNIKMLQQSSTDRVKEVSVPSVSSFIKNSDLVLHPVSSPTPNSSTGTSASSPNFCKGLIEQEGVLSMEKESILSCSFESDQPYNVQSLHNFTDFNTTFYQPKQSWLPHKNESNSDTSWSNPTMHSKQPKFFTQHGTVQVVKTEIIDKPIQNTHTSTLHPMKTVQQPKNHLTNVHTKNENNLQFQRMTSIGAHGSFVSPYQPSTQQRPYKVSQTGHPYFHHLNTHVTIPYRPRYNRRNNPELEKKRVHKCDHPGK